MNYYKNIPIASSKNIPLALLGQCDGDFGGGYRRRHYNTAEQIEKFACDKYKKNGQGLTFNDLLSYGLASSKKQSQHSLKHYRRNGILFTISAHKPQQYYPARLKSEIIANKMEKNIPIGVTGVGCCYSCLNPTAYHFSSNSRSIQAMIANQSLEGLYPPFTPISTIIYPQDAVQAKDYSRML